MPDHAAALVLAPKVALRRLGEDQGAVMVRFHDGQLFTCNDVTAAFLEALDGRRTFNAVVDHLLESFEVDRAELVADLRPIAERLAAEGLIRPADADADGPGG